MPNRKWLGALPAPGILDRLFMGEVGEFWHLLGSHGRLRNRHWYLGGDKLLFASLPLSFLLAGAASWLAVCMSVYVPS